MNAGGPSESSGRTPEDDASSPVADLSPRSRIVGVVVWCSFLTAAAATMVLFAFLDPAALQPDAHGGWVVSHRAIYAAGFFFLWVVAGGAAALAVYMVRTERTQNSPGS